MFYVSCRRFAVLGSTLAIAVGIADAASSATIVQTTDPSDVLLDLFGNGYFERTFEPFTFAAFDGALGTLTGVSLDVAIAASFVGDFFYEYQTVGTDDEPILFYSGNWGASASAVFNLETSTGVLYSAFAEDFDGGGGEGEAASPTAPEVSDSFRIDDRFDVIGYQFRPEDFAGFTGPASVFGDIQYEIGYGGSGGNLQGRFEASARGTLTYTYDPFVAPVPLPAGMPLMLGGLGAFGVLRRMRGKRVS